MCYHDTANTARIKSVGGEYVSLYSIDKLEYQTKNAEMKLRKMRICSKLVLISNLIFDEGKKPPRHFPYSY